MDLMDVLENLYLSLRVLTFDGSKCCYSLFIGPGFQRQGSSEHGCVILSPDRVSKPDQEPAASLTTGPLPSPSQGELTEPQASLQALGSMLALHVWFVY